MKSIYTYPWSTEADNEIMNPKQLIVLLCKLLILSLFFQEQIRSQPMSAKDAQHLLQEIRDAEDVLEKNRQMGVEKQERVEELQMQHNKWVYLWEMGGWMDRSLDEWVP